MALEDFDITKDNIAKDSFLSLLANVSEQYNILLKKETITIDETTKILSQIMEAYSFYNTIKQSELTQELSDARIQLNQIATTFQNLEQFKGEKGDKGDNGLDFTFDMFTPEQLEALKGAKGDKGDQGEKGIDGTMTFEDLTPEQILSLKGDKGDNGLDGSNGTNGLDFTFDMFTPEQLQALKGDKGDKGDNGLDGSNGTNGLDFTYDMFTPQQLEALKGAKGDKGDNPFSFFAFQSFGNLTFSIDMQVDNNIPYFVLVRGSHQGYQGFQVSLVGILLNDGSRISLDTIYSFGSADMGHLALAFKSSNHVALNKTAGSYNGGLTFNYTLLRMA